MIGQRMRQLRLARGLSLEALAAEMGGLVTKQALSKYEQGQARPSATVLNKLASALGVRSAQLWGQSPISVQFIGHRKGSGLLVREKAKVESMVSQALEVRVRLQELTQQASDDVLTVRGRAVRSLEDVEQAANEQRASWKLGLDPIANVVDTLEEQCIHVLRIDTGVKFDGLSAVARDGDGRLVAAAAVTRREIPGERQRLNLAHELGHLMLKVSESLDEERAAFRFGAAFLAPAATLRREVGTKRAFIQPEELLLLKKRFGMSVQALLYRLRDLGVITESTYRVWCMQVNALGWRKREPLEMEPEQPQWLRRNALRAFAEGALPIEEAQAMLGEPMEGKQPLSLVERRAFLKLPAEERRRIMAEQAERMAAHYEQDAEWAGLQAGDLIEQ